MEKGWFYSLKGREQRKERESPQKRRKESKRDKVSAELSYSNAQDFWKAGPSSTQF